MREVIPLYRSVLQGVRDLDPETFKRLMLALMEYGIEDKEPELSGLERTVFESWKANINARIKDSDNGKKGGRPSRKGGYETNNPLFETENPPFETENPPFESEKHITETKTETETETETKTETKTKTKTKTDSAPKHKHGRYSHVLLTDTEYLTLKTAYGEQQAEAAIDYLDEYIERKGYQAKSHYLAIRKWVFDAIREEQIKRQELQQREQRVQNQGKPPDIKQGIQRTKDFDAFAQRDVNLRTNQSNLEWISQFRGDG